jgi:hypothetical protein
MELGSSIPLALDDTAYHIELTYMSAVWLFTCLSRRLDQALKGDETWGIWSIRGRLLWYLEAVIEMTAAASVLPGINETAQGWLSELRLRARRNAPQVIPCLRNETTVTKPRLSASGHSRRVAMSALCPFIPQ